MATNKINSMAKTPFGRLLSQGEMALAIGVIGIFAVIIIPVPPFLLDILITVNIFSYPSFTVGYPPRKWSVGFIHLPPDIVVFGHFSG